MEVMKCCSQHDTRHVPFTTRWSILEFLRWEPAVQASDWTEILIRRTQDGKEPRQVVSIHVQCHVERVGSRLLTDHGRVMHN